MKHVKMKLTAIAVIVSILLTILGFMGLVGINDAHEWRVKQSLTGNVTVIDQPGPYLRMFASVWDYDKANQSYFSASEKEGGAVDDSIRVTFNDGSTANISSMVRWLAPVTKEKRLALHEEYTGNIDNVEASIRAYLINVMKNTAPLMSASEHQSARKSEFDRLVYEQLVDGTYLTRKIEKELKDQFDEDGQPITVFATEVVLGDDGTPIISKSSPLTDYGITVRQFSVTATDYDKQTLEQFKAKKASFLRAEQSKAEREEMVQKRLKVVEQGLMEKAEVEAQANKEKAQATIQAQKEKEVAETQAAKQLEVARLEKQTAETRAAQKLEVARLEKEAAAEQAEARKLLADAKKYELEQADGLSEEVEYTLKIQKETQIGIAAALANVRVPTIQMSGTGGDGTGGNMNEQLMNMVLLREMGVMGNKGNVTVTPNN